MEQLTIPCQHCGQAARVRILEGYVGGEPVLKAFCMGCADQAGRAGSFATAGEGHSVQRLSLAALLIFAGLFIVFMGIAGDRLGIHTKRGFGWHQQVGVLAGALCILVGALLRVDVIAILGTIVFGLAACADLIQITSSPGMGWKQNSAMVLGVVLTAAGIFLRRRV